MRNEKRPLNGLIPGACLMEKELGVVAQSFEWVKGHPFEVLGLIVAALIVLWLLSSRHSAQKSAPPPIPERVRHDLEALKRKREASFANPQAAQQRGITLADMAAFRPQRETPPQKEEEPKSAPKPPTEAVFATLTQYEMQAPPLDEDVLYGVNPKSEKAANPPAAESAQSPKPAAPPTSNAMIACPNCGKGILAEARFCGYCGKKTEP